MNQKDNQKKLVLYYGLETQEQEKSLLDIFTRLDIQGIRVEKEAASQTVGGLAGLIRTSDKPCCCDNPPEDSVIVMHGFEDADIRQFLQAIRDSQSLAINLKAVITERNINWSFCELTAELQQEHKLMQTFMAVHNLAQQAEQWISTNADHLNENNQYKMLAERMSEAISRARMIITAAQNQEEIDIRQLARTGQKISALLDQLSDSAS